MIALRMAQLMEFVISPTQSGFVPHRSTSLNLRTLFATLNQINPDLPAAAILLDTEKAFDSLEWPFLSSILRRMGMPKGFIALVELLYSKPTARLRLNNTLSLPFQLHRGPCQGCPLSPLLFILAMDPLVRLLHDEHIHRGLQLNTGPLLTSLYADDVILYVRQPQQNLAPLIREVSRFGLYSGLKMNWNKSVIFPLTSGTKQWDCEFPLIWCTEPTKYLGIHIHLDKQQIIRLNYGPAIDSLASRIDSWIRLPLSIAGRASLIKMVVLPKFLYLFNNIPIPLTNHFFATLQSHLTRLLWGGKQPRVRWQVLTLPYNRGGFSIPDFKLYYLVAQCSYAHAWYHTVSKLPYVCPESDLVLPNQLTTVLPNGLPRDPLDIQTVSTTSWAWLKLSRLM